MTDADLIAHLDFPAQLTPDEQWQLGVLDAFYRFHFHMRIINQPEDNKE